MSGTYTHKFDTEAYKGDVTIHTGLFIVGGGSIEVKSLTATGKVVTSLSVGTKKDVDLAVDAALKAYKTTWGLRCPGSERGKLINKLADLIEKHIDKFAALEALDVGKVFKNAKYMDITGAISTFRYYAGWADKVQGKTIETRDTKFAYIRHEPYGVVGQIVPWNFPMPALATGNTIILKPSEITPLSALKLADLINEAGFPPGVVNIVNGYGHTVGQAITERPQIQKVAFTGSTLTGRKVPKASAETNLKVVTLELGGKSPTVIFDDAALDQSVQWASIGQACSADSRIFVQEGIYDAFLAKFTEVARGLARNTGDPFTSGTEHGPQVFQLQFDRVINYIDIGKPHGAKVHIGGERHGTEGFFIKPTIFTECSPSMRISQEEIFRPVSTITMFKTEEEAIEMANNTVYGLACHIFTQNISRGIRVAHALEAGSAWVNSAQTTEPSVPLEATSSPVLDASWENMPSIRIFLLIVGTPLATVFIRLPFQIYPSQRCPYQH
ncbi:aldehyde dehydrogenase [Flammula alnicola]|nr:aldehyde dehydrogenase [Flammula alnicola]